MRTDKLPPIEGVVDNANHRQFRFDTEECVRRMDASVLLFRDSAATRRGISEPWQTEDQRSAIAADRDVTLSGASQHDLSVDQPSRDFSQSHHHEETSMTANTETTGDYFWVYVACATLALVGIIGLVKLAENDKYDPIRKQLQEDAAKMNIRILKTDQ